MFTLGRKAMLAVVLSIIGALFAQPAFAQVDSSACDTDSKQYASWLDVLDSVQGEVTGTATIEEEQLLGNAYFALINSGEIMTSDYYVQVATVEESYSEFFSLLVKDSLVANFNEGWSVESRDSEYSGFADLENAFMQFNTFMTAAFVDLRFIDMSQCLGINALPTGDAIHYKLTIPPLMGRMLITQLLGEELTDIEFGEFTFDYWLDTEKRFLAQLNTIIEATDTSYDETMRLDFAFTIGSIDNIQIQVPYPVQFMAMEAGIIEPNFVADIVIVE